MDGGYISRLFEFEFNGKTYETDVLYRYTLSPTSKDKPFFTITERNIRSVHNHINKANGVIVFKSGNSILKSAIGKVHSDSLYLPIKDDKLAIKIFKENYELKIESYKRQCRKLEYMISGLRDQLNFLDNAK